MILSAPGPYAKKSGGNTAKPHRSPIVVRRRPGTKTQGILSFGPLRMPCAIGRSGTTSAKREGDGATPVGAMRLICGYFRPERARPFPSPLPFLPARSDLGWCDDPGNANYNRPVRLPCKGSRETMIRGDRLYDICIVLDWNLRSRQRGRGSAIFLHIAMPGFPPTQGCIALLPGDMRRLLPFVADGSVLQVMR